MNTASVEHIEMETLSCWVDKALPAYDAAGKPNFLDDEGDIVEGIFLDLPNDVYHSLNALSSSAVKKFMESPASYFRQYRSTVERKRTLAQKRTFDAGTYGHELCLEPQGFYERYFRDLVPSDVPNALHTISEIETALLAAGLPAKEGRNEKRERCVRLMPQLDLSELKTISALDMALEDNGFNKAESKLDKSYRLMANDPNALVFDYVFSQNRLKHGECITKVDEQNESFEVYGMKRPIDGIVWDDAHRVQATVLKHTEGSLYLTQGLPEVAIFARCSTTGMMLKVKFDWLRFDNDAVDLKTTLSAKPEEFRRQLLKLHYDIQAAFYTYVAGLMGIVVDDFTFVAVEYLHADICQPYTLSRKLKIKANSKLQQALKEFHQCNSTNRWYGYHKEDCTIELD